MPFPGTMIDSRRGKARIEEPSLLADINKWRDRWGLPRVTVTGVHDPQGVVHQLEREHAETFAGTGVKAAGMFIKMVGFVTGNRVVKEAGKIVSKIGEHIIAEAAEDIAALSPAVAQAYAEELAHWFVSRWHLARNRTYVVAPLAAPFYRRSDGTLIDLRHAAEEPLEIVSNGAHFASFMPITDSPAIERLIPDSAIVLRMRERTEFFRRAVTPEILFQMLKPPLTEEQQEAIELEQAPFRAVNRLHPFAQQVLIRRPEWNALVNERRIAFQEAALTAQRARMELTFTATDPSRLDTGLATLAAMVGAQN